VIARFWQHMERAAMDGDRPQTPYDGFQRSYKSIDGDGNWRPCAAKSVKPLARGRSAHQRGSVALAFLIVLALSLAANAFMWHRIGVEHDGKVAAEASLDTANKATQACNDSVTELERQAKSRDAENLALRKEAENRRRAQESLAQQILSTPATVPGNDCQSARDRVVNWLKARKP
jgi:hypothetical protein